MERNQGERENVLKELWGGLKKLFIGIFVILFSVVIIVVIGSFTLRDNKPTPVDTVAYEPVDIVVTSQIVKPVDGKYRYFFDIRNQDTKSFTGNVNINLVNSLGQSIYDKDFTAVEPISSGVGKSVYFDTSTGPTSVHGENGIETFTYTVTNNGQTVKSDSGTISTQK